MKKNLSISSLRGLTIGAVAVALLTSGVIAQPNEKANSAEQKYMERLENHMTIALDHMKYEAPDQENEWTVSGDLIQNMDMVAAVTENLLKYKAPANSESEIEYSLFQVSEKNKAIPVKTTFSRNTSGNAQFITTGYHREKSGKYFKKSKCRSTHKQLAQKN